MLIVFIVRDVKGARDAKKSFDRAADDYSTSLSKYSSANKVKPSEIDDVNSNLANSRANFRSVSMDYVVQVSRRMLTFDWLNHVMCYRQTC